MSRRGTVAALLLLAGLSGCLGEFGNKAAGPGQDDGSVAWLLPAKSEVPSVLVMADAATASRFLAGTANPGPLTEQTWRSIGHMVDEPQEPHEHVAAVYQRQGEPRHVVVVVAARFERAQGVQDWRAYEGAFGMPVPGAPATDGTDDDSGGGYDIFWSLCGLRARYGFVRGHDALLVLGNLDVTGDTPSGLGIRGPALELEAAVRDRAAGTPICLEKERVIHRSLAIDEGSLLPSRARADGLEDVDPMAGQGAAEPAASSDDAAASESNETMPPPNATFAPPGVEPLVEDDGGASIRHGPLAPGETQWFSFEVLQHSCLYMGFRGQMGMFDIVDPSGQSVDRGWGADQRDGAHGFNQDLYDAGRFFLEVQAYPEGTGVDELWLELTPRSCPLAS